MKYLIVWCSACLLMGNVHDSSLKNEGLTPGFLSCEYLENPFVVDVAQPRLAWINTAREGERGQKQTAWQVRVASSVKLLEEPDLWDSKKQLSMQSVRVKYQGKELESGQECWWQVRVWDRNDVVSDWSDPGMWRMGLLNPDDWNAQWIGAPWQGEEPIERPGQPDGEPEDMGPPAPMLRKNFEVEKRVESAVAYVCGLGYFEFFLNGNKVGHDVLVPNQTNYGYRPKLQDARIALPDSFSEYKVMYLAYDVKDYLRKGKNTIGSIVGNGFYNPGKFWTEGYGTPRFLCQLHITYTDGTEKLVLSDSSWTASKSPILLNMVYYGEIYDAREEQAGWCTLQFDDSHWEAAAVRRPPEGRLVAHTAHPDQVTERLAPVSVEKLGEGHYFVDFGVEISGWVRLIDVKAPIGHQVEIIPKANLYSGKNTYIFGEDGLKTYAPRFNWFVFSGLEIKNWPGELKPEQLVAEAVNTYIEPSATFESSNGLFNEINRIWRSSQLDNMHGGIASDCPHRERSGYTGDGQIACNTVLHNFDARNFYQKWITDMRDAQIPESGYVPNGAPWQPGCGGGPAWGAAICVMPWEYYVQYGSRDMLEDNYQAMKGYLRYLLSWTGEDGIMHSRRTGNDGSIIKWYNLGEWLPPGELIPDEMVHTFVLWYCAHLTSKTAGVLGMLDEAELYQQLAERTREAFQKRFYKENEGSYGDAGGNILALKMEVPEEQYAQVLAALKAGILKNGGHLDTGILGTRFFFEVLAGHGLNQLAFEAMNKRTEPSYGHWIELGSTTTRENWNEEGSHNHPIFGGGLVWFYRNLAGMQADPSEPGYRHIIFRPQPVRELEYVSYKNNTPYGRGGITWKNEENAFVMEVEIPVGCRATVHVPADVSSEITEGGLATDQAEGITFREWKEGYALFEAESGSYSFRVAH
ncbi:MAG: alpha-L-rhamnosidase N-terminal domain-containing protein [Bacteroidales bacterium]|nr:alpha-L-rhamnosidase N-terminal domain-containing protein [Bacteroidales bacterium]